MSLGLSFLKCSVWEHTTEGGSSGLLGEFLISVGQCALPPASGRLACVRKGLRAWLGQRIPRGSEVPAPRVQSGAPSGIGGPCSSADCGPLEWRGCTRSSRGKAWGVRERWISLERPRGPCLAFSGPCGAAPKAGAPRSWGPRTGVHAVVLSLDGHWKLNAGAPPVALRRANPHAQIETQTTVASGDSLGGAPSEELSRGWKASRESLRVAAGGWWGR